MTPSDTTHRQYQPAGGDSEVAEGMERAIPAPIAATAD
jgi:hypothetical protein